MAQVSALSSTPWGDGRNVKAHLSTFWQVRGLARSAAPDRAGEWEIQGVAMLPASSPAAPTLSGGPCRSSLGRQVRPASAAVLAQSNLAVADGLELQRGHNRARASDRGSRLACGQIGREYHL